MAKVKTNFQRLAALIKVPIAGPGSLSNIGEFVSTRIKGFTRLGYSLADKPSEPKQNKLKPLSPTYIRARKNWLTGWWKPPKGGVGISFSAARSQLTASGQMLESISYVVNPSSKTIRVMVTDKPRRDGDSNIRIARKNVADGRPFMGIDQIGIETIKTRYVKSLYRRMRATK